MHPATWFKVVFPPETKVITFRPSALHPVDEEGRLYSNYVVKPSISRGYSANRIPEPPVTKASLQNRQRALSSTTIASTASGVQSSDPNAFIKGCFANGSARRPSATFSSGGADADFWAGKKVMVISGRHMGQVGVARSSGNGWVQIDTPLGEIAKRAAELTVMQTDGGMGGFFPSFQQNESMGDRDTFVKMEDSDAEDKSARRGGARKRSNEAIISRDEIGEAKRLRLSSNSSLGGNRNARLATAASSRASSATRVYGYSESQTTTQDTIPLQHSSILEAKRAFIQKYVEKTQIKIQSRPNLIEWKVKLNASLFNNRTAEIQAARRFDESVCSICCTERWPGAKFCWNQACVKSPVYNSSTNRTVTSDILLPGTNRNHLSSVTTYELQQSPNVPISLSDAHQFYESLREEYLQATVRDGDAPIDESNDTIGVTTEESVSADHGKMEQLNIKM